MCASWCDLFSLPKCVHMPYLRHLSLMTKIYGLLQLIIKRPTRDACLCMGDLQAPPALHFVFLINL